MIEYTEGDILQSDGKAEALVNTVNCVGVMGRGIALQFKKAYPENFRAYAKACKKGDLRLGRMFVYETGRPDNPRYIINFPTKQHWRNKSQTKSIEEGLEDLVEVIRKNHIQSIAIPPLGCGLGGLRWNEVKSRITTALEPLTDVNVIVFEPGEAPAAEEMRHAPKEPEMTTARAVLVALMRRYLCGGLDPTVSLLEVHKLMYFMQEAGEPLKLVYRKARYGPYAENLRHLMNTVEGHYVTGYADGDDTPWKQLDLKPDAVEKAQAFLEEHPKTHSHLGKVADLVEGFESPFGLELLSTAHWSVKHEEIRSMQEVVKAIYRWGDRKQRFTERQIGIAVETLQSKGWIENVSA